MQFGLKWLHDNREWVFSGCGLLVISGVIGLVRWFLNSSTPIGLRIEMSFGLLTFGPKLSDQLLLFTVTNPGEKPAQIALKAQLMWIQIHPPCHVWSPFE